MSLSVGLLGCQLVGQGPDRDYALDLQTTWAKEYVTTCQQLYCFKTVPSSGTMQGTIRFDGQRATARFEKVSFTGDVSPGPGDSVSMYLKGDDGRVYSNYYLRGVRDEHNFLGTWNVNLDPHGLGYGGTFTGRK